MTNEAPVLIPVKDRRQAMDWSLVLASQGIEVGIAQVEGERFALEVAAVDSTRAFQVLKLYHKETRGWNWWMARTEEGPHLETLAMFWVLALIFWHAMADKWPGIEAAGVMDSQRFALGDWWRLFTAVTLHSDLAHLAANCSIGLLFFCLAGARYGLGISLLTSYLAGVLGNVAGWMVYDGPYNSLGASGMVMGAVGLIIARPVIGQAPMLKWKGLLVTLSAGAMLFLLVGASGSPETDMVAHVAGFVAGLVFGWRLRRWPQMKEPRVQNRALSLFLFMLSVPWCLALGRS
ncbi:MAG TPA: rhomboid family intramembrane serine protease [Verrucomicrobiae bacterium]